jgi:hypothetical protein
MHPKLVRTQQCEGHGEGSEIINRAIGDQGAQQATLRHGPQQQQQDGLEHADAAGNIADHAGGDRDQIDAGKRREADRGLLRQQHV